MLQLSYVREHKNEIIDRLKIRNFDGEKVINEIVERDEVRRQSQTEADAQQAELNKMSKEIGAAFKSGDRQKAEKLKAKTGELKTSTKELFERVSKAERQINNLLLSIPNVPNAQVPAGKSDEDNEVIEEFGQKPELTTDAKPHWDLAKEYDIIDFERGVKVTGAGFPIYTGKGARLQRALISFFLDEAERAGYKEIVPPLLVNESTGIATGQLPDKEGQMYHVQEEDLYLIPTAEVPITNIYRDELLKKEDLPVKMCGYTPCFRREAGSYGKDVRGLNRLHQFDKVEIVQITRPEDSNTTLNNMVEYVKSLLAKLELNYRTLRLCGGDLGFTAALTFDLEVYSAAQKRWLEVSSISNFETYQANRLKCRFKDENNKTRLVHTLNGSALAFPRILAALIENNQTEKGIKIPAALVPYTGFEYITK